MTAGGTKPSGSLPLHWATNRRTGRWCGSAGSFAPSAAAPGEWSGRPEPLDAGRVQRVVDPAVRQCVEVRHQRPEGASVSDRYPQGRDRPCGLGSAQPNRARPRRGTPIKFVLVSSSSNGTRIRATRITPSDRHRTAPVRIARRGVGNGRAAGSVRFAPRRTRHVAGVVARPFPAGSVGPPAGASGCSSGRGRKARCRRVGKPVEGRRCWV